MIALMSATTARHQTSEPEPKLLADPTLCACNSGLRRTRCCGLSSAGLPDPANHSLLDATVELAKTARTGGRNREAERYLLQVLDLAPLHREALRVLYELRRAENRLQAAEALIKRICSIDPPVAVILLQYAQLLIGLGRHADAEAPARAALKLAPREAASHHMIGMIFTETNRVLAGERHYRLALSFSEPNDAAIISNLAWNLKLQGRLDEAAALYQSAMAQRAENPRTLSGLAQVEAGRGNFDRAVALIGQAKEAAPSDRMIGLLDALARLQRNDPTGCIERIDATAAAIAPQSLVATELAAKGQALERLGDFEAAFSAYQQARSFQRERAGRRFDPAPLDQRLAALKQTFLSDRLGALPRAPIQPGAPMPIFLLGTARSGTSLLESMLAQIPGIDPADDRGPLPDLSRLLPKMIAGLGGPASEFPDALIDTIAGDARDVIPMLGARYLRSLQISGIANAETRFITDRSADLPWTLGLAAMLFPTAPVIQVLRHPLDVGLSCFAQDRLYPGNAGVTLESAAKFYDITMSAISHIRGQMTLRYLPVRYEDLITAPVATFARVLEFIGIQVDAAAALTAPARKVPRTPAYAVTREKLHRRSLNRHQNFGARLDPMRPILNPWIEALGYTPSTQQAA